MSATLSQSALARGQGRNLWRRWTLYMAAGELIGFAAPALLVPLALSLGASDFFVGLVMLVAGALEGACLGMAQWLVLCDYLPRLYRWEWTLATAAGAVMAYLLALALNLLRDLADFTAAPFWILLAAALLLAFVLSLGFCQWLVLRPHIPNAAWWMPVNAVAWPLGVAVPVTALALIPDSSPLGLVILTGIVSGVLMGLLVGALTGLALVRLLRPNITM